MGIDFLIAVIKLSWKGMTAPERESFATYPSKPLSKPVNHRSD